MKGMMICAALALVSGCHSGPRLDWHEPAYTVPERAMVPPVTNCAAIDACRMHRDLDGTLVISGRDIR